VRFKQASGVVSLCRIINIGTLVFDLGMFEASTMLDHLGSRHFINITNILGTTGQSLAFPVL